ncbi:MAG TPA: alpha/beta hydrolase [Syntrophales bacterium]|nr:alpha/beta hydrolase [Syntrophales bacterium]HON22408.1 alpha/beta hydrolase [Syntrophales bacterium]HOU77170.1 alpha/beta hydrolase [Syntrophales bacterium]HPC32065.1 alpha/beta hydrolase [Syntrophales bacterium]HQG33812.1 alpha/beta hydrolase [Syntrophales bacterium]
MKDKENFRSKKVEFLAAGRRLAGVVLMPGHAGGPWGPAPGTDRRTAAGGVARSGSPRVRDDDGGGESPGGEKSVLREEGAATGRARDFPWLVFLHEGLGSIGQWRDFPVTLCEKTGLPGLVYDRWGYGGAEVCREQGNRDYLHREALTFLPRVLDHFGIARAVFIGHSDGGTIALIFGGAYPERTAGIITEAAHVFVEDVTLAGIRDAVTAYATTDLKARLARYHGDKTDLVFRRWSETWLGPSFRDWNIEALLPRVGCPVLAIQGEDDPYGTPAQVKAIVAQTAGPAEGFLVPRCGHIPHTQARETVLAAMASFIGKVISPGDVDREVPNTCAARET